MKELASYAKSAINILYVYLHIIYHVTMYILAQVYICIVYVHVKIRLKSEVQLIK